MTVEQTRWFRESVEHFTHIGTEYRYSSGREKIADDLMKKTANLRGKSDTIKICKKANQRLKNTFFDWRKI